MKKQSFSSGSVNRFDKKEGSMHGVQESLLLGANYKSKNRRHMQSGHDDSSGSGASGRAWY
jgi:hypothetical protein